MGEREKDLPSARLFFKWLQCPGLVQTKAEALNSAGLPNEHQESTHRELNGIRAAADGSQNQHYTMGYQHQKQQLEPLATMLDPVSSHSNKGEVIPMFSLFSK